MQNKIVNFVLFAVIAIAAVKAGNYLSERPPFLTPCNFNDANFRSCFAKNFQVLFVEWRDGIPGLKNVGKLDPLEIKRVKIQQDGNSALSVNAIMDNMVVTGASKAVVKEANLDRDTFIITAKVFVPKLTFNTDYKAKGRVLSINLNGQGKAFFESESLVLSFHIKTKLRHTDEFIFTDIISAKAKIDEIGNFRIRVDNLFNGQKDLEDSANLLFNQNWREFYDILNPAIQQTLQLVLEDRFKRVFAYVPSNYLIENLPGAS